MSKTNREVIQELADIIFDKINGESGGNKLMLMPALNIVKLKMSSMSEDDCEFVIDAVHKISNHIERETGVLSPYHGIEINEA